MAGTQQDLSARLEELQKIERFAPPDGFRERAVVRDAAGVESEAVSGDGAWIATSRVPELAVRFEAAGASSLDGEMLDFCSTPGPCAESSRRAQGAVLGSTAEVREMELARLELATSWVRSRRSPN